MPYARINGCNLYYEDHGGQGETIVFAHSVLWSGEMFEAQVRAFKEHYRCITFDFRGQGRSEVAGNGYEIECLADDTVRLFEALNCAPCHLVGVSLGGIVGMHTV